MGKCVMLAVSIPIPDSTQFTSDVFARELVFESVRDALRGSLDPIARNATVEYLDNSHAKLFHDDYGLVVECGLPRPVRIYPGGGWIYPGDPDGNFDELELMEGDDFDSLADLVQRLK